MELPKVIKKLRGEANLSQREVAQRAHTPQAYISQIETGVRAPSERMLEDILIKGIGLPYKRAQRIIKRWKLKKIGLPSKLAELAETDFVVIPILGFVPCGDPKKDLKDAEGHISLPKSLTKRGHHIFGVKAEGLSMIEEGIMPNDTIICDADAKIKNGDIAVVRLKNKETLKRVYFKKANVELRGGNKGFDPIKVKKDKIKIIGKIIYHVKKF